MKSPITGLNNVILEQEIHTSLIIERYKKELGMDVSKFFKSIDKISLYRCLDTGYKFYYPFNISGDSDFYQELEKFHWYYMDWKWEHTITLNVIKSQNKVLEIGCAHGTFLNRLKKTGAQVEGLEMNKGALDDCVKKGLKVLPDSIEKFSLNHSNTYDIVCSFQVLEHVSDVRGFIEASLTVLKPGGQLIIAVPNNSNFILKSGNVLLDMPPHHMGQWEMNSLIGLQDYFDMRIHEIHMEPLQDYHVSEAHKVAYEKLEQKLREKFGIFSKILYPIGKPFARLGVNAIKDLVVGHTILAIYKKNK